MICVRCGKEFKPASKVKHFCSWKCRYDSAGRFWSHVDKSGECWLWTGYHISTGYGRLGVNGKVVATHRFSYELHNGPIPDGLCVCHTCDNPSCVNPVHLFLGTQQENIADRNQKGRTAKGDRAGPRTHPERYIRPRGEKNPRAKLDWPRVTAIRERYTAGNIHQRALAAEYGVSRTLIRLIIQGKVWIE